MSTTTPEATLVDLLTTEFFDGRTFSGHSPSAAYAPRYREDIRLAFETLVARYRDIDLTAYTDEQVGERVYAAFDSARRASGHEGHNGITSAHAEVGAWIKDVLSRGKGSFDGQDAGHGFVVGDEVRDTEDAHYGFLRNGDTGIVTNIAECVAKGWSMSSQAPEYVLVKDPHRDHADVYRPRMLEKVKVVAADEPEHTYRFPLPDWKDALGESSNMDGPTITTWATNDEWDIQPTVEEQLRTIIARYPTRPEVVGSSATDGHEMYTSEVGRASSELKEFVSAAMRHKTERMLRPGTQFTLKDAGQGEFSLDGIYIGEGGGRRSATYTVESVGMDRRPPVMNVNVERNGHGVAYVLAHHVVPLPLLSPGKDDTPEKEDSMTEVIEEIPDVESLRREVANLKAQVERLAEKERGLMRDGRLITEGIAKEAEERSWCREYEQFAEEMNTHLRYFEFEMRDRTYEVTIHYTVSDSGSRTYTVSAQDEDSAREEAQSMFENEEATDLWDHADGRYDVNEDDYSVEEA